MPCLLPTVTTCPTCWAHRFPTSPPVPATPCPNEWHQEGPQRTWQQLQGLLTTTERTWVSTWTGSRLSLSRVATLSPATLRANLDQALTSLREWQHTCPDHHLSQWGCGIQSLSHLWSFIWLTEKLLEFINTCNKKADFHYYLYLHINSLHIILLSLIYVYKPLDWLVFSTSE